VVGKLTLAWYTQRSYRLMGKANHPAGTKKPAVTPVQDILSRLQAVVEENYWLYGAPTADAPNRLERWDVRSMVDYAVMTYKPGHFHLSFPTFYRYRNDTMEALFAAKNDLWDGKADEYIENYGDWRMWETEKDRTQMSIQQVVVRALRLTLKEVNA
jgi:hypothetical protein